MQTMIAALTCVLLMWVVCLLAAAFLPLFTIVNCARRDDVVGRDKTVWIVLMLLVWTPAAILYGLFKVKPRTLIGVVSWANVVSVVLAGLVTVSAQTFSKIYLADRLTAALTSLAPAGSTAVCAKACTKMLSKDLTNLKARTITLSLLNIDGRRKVFEAIEVLEKSLKDGKISLQELAEWQGKYAAAIQTRRIGMGEARQAH